MGKVRRKFDSEFKENLVRQILAGQITISQAAREHQLSITVIRRWKEKLQAGQPISGPSKRERELEGENRELKQKLAELYMQVELLKKVDDWKRRNKSVDSSVITSSNWAQFRKGAK